MLLFLIHPYLDNNARNVHGTYPHHPNHYAVSLVICNHLPLFQRSKDETLQQCTAQRQERGYREDAEEEIQETVWSLQDENQWLWLLWWQDGSGQGENEAKETKYSVSLWLQPSKQRTFSYALPKRNFFKRHFLKITWFTLKNFKSVEGQTDLTNFWFNLFVLLALIFFTKSLVKIFQIKPSFMLLVL